jgi:hypothetical protein
MKIKKSLFVLAAILITLVVLFGSCSSNNQQGGKGNNSVISNLFLELGYENCLICHNSDDNNNIINLSFHCLYFDPTAYVKINDINYSPSLNDCLLCHTSHFPNGAKNIYNCGPCHFG